MRPKNTFKQWSQLMGMLILGAMMLTACVDEETFANDPNGNFEALWKVMDEHYCFFNEKNIDWNEVHTRYSKQVDVQLKDGQLFEIMTNMLSELRDGHVNLFSPFDTGRNWSWFENYPANSSDTLMQRYLGTDYLMATGLKYRIFDDNIGYIRCESFESSFGEGNLDEILKYMLACNGLIIDLRNNGGGMLTAAEQLAARFTNEEILVGYMQHKTGRGHNDFSTMEEQHLKPSKGIRWQKGVVVLTNRRVFSAANEFVKYMKCCPKVKIVGDQTGGGAGMPFSSELPNGWSIRLSACPMYDKDKHSTEKGIKPDYQVGLNEADILQGKDTLIEFARKILSK